MSFRSENSSPAVFKPQRRPRIKQRAFLALPSERMNTSSRLRGRTRLPTHDLADVLEHAHQHHVVLRYCPGDYSALQNEQETTPEPRSFTGQLEQTQLGSRGNHKRKRLNPITTATRDYVPSSERQSSSTYQCQENPVKPIYLVHHWELPPTQTEHITLTSKPHTIPVLQRLRSRPVKGASFSAPSQGIWEHPHR